MLLHYSVQYSTVQYFNVPFGKGGIYFNYFIYCCVACEFTPGDQESLIISGAKIIDHNLFVNCISYYYSTNKPYIYS